MTERSTVVLTALDVEYMAVRARLVDLGAHPHPRGTRFEVGRLGDDRGRRIALGLVGKGNHAAAVLAERAVTEFSPAAVFFVGVAGALKPWLPLGDVVVATHVYAPHGGTSQDDGLKSRPRVWETSHAVLQEAQHLARTRGWTGHGTGTAFGVHFGPVAAGEVVLNSATSSEAEWIRDKYNDALVIEMEGAGVAQAGHLNAPLAVVVVRAASDRADGSKEITDGARWQETAADHAATFALALADELATAEEDQARAQHTTGSHAVGHTKNIAKDNARVGLQVGHLYGDVHQTTESTPVTVTDVAAELRRLRRELRRSRETGRLDPATYREAEVELSHAERALPADSPERASRLLIALKRLRGLVHDVAELAGQLSTIIAVVQGRS